MTDANVKISTIAGYKFEISMPYAEGHAVTAAEAAVLNQTRAENIGNNLRGAIKEKIESVEGDLNEKQVAAIQLKVTEYDNEYQLVAKRPAAPKVTDPVEKMARKLARDAVNAALRKKGVKRKDLPEDVQSKLAQKEEEMAVKDGPVWKDAEAAVKKQEKATDGLLDDLGVTAQAAE